MGSQRWMLTVCLYVTSMFVIESEATAESQTYTCRTFGSGVVQPFNGSAFYVHSNCPFTLIRFTHNRVECDITVRRGNNGLLTQVEIIINKVTTVLQDGSILVMNNRVSLPYDQTYQHIFPYGIYTRLRSSLLPLSVTWHKVSGGIDRLWVELEQELSPDMTGLCGKQDTVSVQQLITETVLPDNTCQTRDLLSPFNSVCLEFISETLECPTVETTLYLQLCEANIYGYASDSDVSCSFFKEVVLMCGESSRVWNTWRIITNCAPPTCPGDLLFVEDGPAFVPSCSNPIPMFLNQENTSSCVCPAGEVLNDHVDGHQCVSPSMCRCVFRDQSYEPGAVYSTKCQTCFCDDGRWNCSKNYCSDRCIIEGQFVTTFDGKQYTLPGKCEYVASQGSNWTIKIEFSKMETSLKSVTLQLFQETFTFTQNKVKVGDQEIGPGLFYQSGDAVLYWQSSMFVQVLTSIGLKIQIQVFPEIQLYIIPPTIGSGVISGLCGNRNGDTTDDFTTSSGIIENSAKLFALSWSLGSCSENIPKPCINIDHEIFADEKCSVLNDPTGIFSKCYDYVPPGQYFTACVQRVCNSGGNLIKTLCAALGSYAKACASLGVDLGDWRKATNCTLKCPNNLEFSYNSQAYNRTCLFLSGLEPLPVLEEAPVEGCGCPEGTYLNQEKVCTPKAQCECYHTSGGVTPPGPVIVDGQQCLCKEGSLRCSKDCGCRNGTVCVHCTEKPVNTLQKTCNNLGKPLGSNLTCESGCYCPEDEYEDHYGRCVPRNNCTCMYSGRIFGAGEHVKTNCKTCTCNQGQWDCEDQPCPGKCQVYGNGHYQTFDSKWYRFDGHCQYTLVEDYCGNRDGTFSVRVESVPCCEEALTCSRSIVLDLENKVTLTLSDMKVTRLLHNGWTMEQDLLYTTHTVGLYIIISVPSKGLTLIWDKHTRITIELHPYWRNKVCGLCGNFDSNEMNDLQISGSSVMASPIVFGNSWKVSSPPCSDVTTELFPCERNSYCAAWAQRRCMILTGDIFMDCHSMVDPEPFYQACVQESCSCEFEGKFLGFCTAVAAYAEACSEQNVCISWRTPDLCPVYCDYYNEQGQCTWHYEACGQMLTCGRSTYFTHKLEGCYPRCPKETPYYDENTARCTELRSCSCYFNETVVPPGETVFINSEWCPCENGTFICPTPTPSTTASTTPLTTTASTTPTSSSAATTITTSSSSTPTTATTRLTSVTNGTEYPTETPTKTFTSTFPPIITGTELTSQKFSTAKMILPTTSTSTSGQTTTVGTVTTETASTTATAQPSPSTPQPTTSRCVCIDLKRNKSWSCGETWTEDCFQKSCVNGIIQLTPVVCPLSAVPACPKNQLVKITDGCCETWGCDCRCELYGDPHFITFQGVNYDFLEDCTYVLVEERSPRYHLIIAVDNFYCAPGILGSCTRGIFLKYQNNTATLRISTHSLTVKATLNSVTVQPPYEKDGMRFQTTGYLVFIYLPEIRSYVSLSPFYTLVVNLAMENFFNNTQGQCGVCGGASCIRKGGKIEDNTCCGKTAYDWLYDDPSKPACFSAPRNVSCHPGPTPAPTGTPKPTPHCTPSPQCQLLDQLVFANCSQVVDLALKKKHCEFDSCTTPNASCSSLFQAAEECKNAGICVDWRRLTEGVCDVPCPKGLLYKECENMLDGYCDGGVKYPGSSLETYSAGCFCPPGLVRAGKHSNDCVKQCNFCKGPLGEPKLPGEVWESECHICTCNNETGTVCVPKPPAPTPLCLSNEVLVNTTCCGDPICVKKTCTYQGKKYNVGDSWKDGAQPCKSFICTTEGIQTETRVCPSESCPKENRIWDDQHCCFTCNQTCVPKISTVNISIAWCTAVLQIPVCEGRCVSQPRVTLSGDLQVQQDYRCCKERSSEKRVINVNCFNLITRQFTYNHITSCECKACSTSLNVLGP